MSSVEAGGGLSSSAQAGRSPPFIRIFVLSWPSTDEMRPTHTGESNLLSSVHQLQC